MNAPPLEVVRRRANGAAVEIIRFDRGAALLALRPTPADAVLREVDGGWVLTTPDRRVYLRLGREEHALWTLIDGRNTVAEIATAYFVKFGSLRVSKVTTFIQMLRRGGLVRVEPAGFLRRRFAHVHWLRREWAWDGLHPWAERAWGLVRPLAAPWNVPFFAGIVLLGLVSWGVDDRVNPASGPVVAAWLAVGFLVNLVVHELAHAVTVVAFGRHVRGLAVGLRGVSVDTTDMYLGSRRDHALVALAGPASNLALATVAATVACALPGEWIAPLRGLVDAGLFAAAVSAWPFLLENDGAHALADYVRVPNLRRESLDALRSGHLLPVHAAYIGGCVLTAVMAPLLVWLTWG